MSVARDHKKSLNAGWLAVPSRSLCEYLVFLCVVSLVSRGERIACSTCCQVPEVQQARSSVT